MKNHPRQIAIGDVHGCHEEFEALLEKVNPGPRDQVVLLGDIINNGPDSQRCLALAREANAICLLGNHERRLLLHRLTGDPRHLKRADRQTISSLTGEDWRQLQKMALYHYLPELETVFVHGGFLPGRPWQTQTADIVTRIQVVDEHGRPRKRAESPGSPHWSKLWHGPPFVVYGHTPRLRYNLRDWSIGIDTACNQGGFLTAFILPEKKVVQVKARRRYS